MTPPFVLPSTPTAAIGKFVSQKKTSPKRRSLVTLVSGSSIVCPSASPTPRYLSTRPGYSSRKISLKSCLVYIDDVIIFSKSVAQHITDVDTILTELAASGMSLKLKKCLFFTVHVKYLGHIIRPGRLQVDLAHVAALKDSTLPTTVTELRSFLGFVNVYRRFIPHFATVAAPLYDLLGGLPKSKKLHHIPAFNSAQLAALNTLVKNVTEPPILALPRAVGRFSVDTDASDAQIGCVLFQSIEAKRQPLGYWSRRLEPREQNYSVSEKESLAVVYSLPTLRHYLLGDEFDIFTDHACLSWLMRIVEPSTRLARWRLRLDEFRLVIRHRKGASHCQADALSRLPSAGHTTHHDDE